ncbi:hypothetical protein J122_1487 [Marinobacter excellens LAMA 842]|uniref:Uncharacterized protein n=1 Tax=Marinobacter excellens LAMA 842 TaxID=1306954 RepID=A0A137SDC3_9GAMM|nr:hypothetical protein J122_1487 [Marinobacter excellens LAMA 842]
MEYRHFNSPCIGPFEGARRWQDALPGNATSTSMCASLRPSMAFEIPGRASCQHLV